LPLNGWISMLSLRKLPLLMRGKCKAVLNCHRL
jgi:hypothetical protein